MTRDEIIEQILPAMTLAPSAHNTQPWRFEVATDRIMVHLDESRHLGASDPTGRQAYTSLGCALLNGQVAAAAVGVGSEVILRQAGESSSSPAATIQLHGAADERLANLHAALAARRTDRRIYDGKPLTDQERARLATLSHEQVQVVEQGTQLKALAALTGKGSYQTLSRKDFKEELSHWVRNSWTKQPDGMPGYAMGMPALISLAAPFLVKVAPLHKQEQANTAKQMRSASLAAVIVTETDTENEWVHTGMLLEQLWLEAVAAGLSAGALAAAVESGEALRHELQDALELKRIPQAILRIGHAPAKLLKATPRRSVADCLGG